LSDAAVDGRTAGTPENAAPEVTARKDAARKDAAGEDAGPGQAGHGPAARPGWLARGYRLIRRHRLFAAVLAAAIVLRAVVMLGYPPVMWFNDSYSYVYDAIHLSTATNHPSGYSFFFLLPLRLFHSFVLVAALQHVLGLALGVGIYALLRRRGLPAWGAALAAVPVLFDAYQVQLEQQVMSDALFIMLVTAAVVLLAWQDRITPLMAVIAGAALGAALLVRSAGLPLLLVVAVCLLARRAGWRPVAALLAAGAVPVAGYLFVYHLQHGPLAMTESDGTFLYGRVMSFADCRVIKPPPPLARLCDPRPPAQRTIAVEYIWRKSDPLWKLGHGLFSPQANAVAQQFALRAVAAQPLSYLRVVASDTWRAFGWTHSIGYDPRTEVLYLFTEPPPQIPDWGYWPALHAFQSGLTQPRAGRPFAAFLGGYQRVVYLPGTLLGLILLTGLGGLAARWRRCGGLVLLPWAVAMALLVVPVATSGFSYRYVVAVVPVACLAAGLAFARQGGRAPGAAGAGSARPPAASGGGPVPASPREDGRPSSPA
jgi:hypothetical protein